MAAIKKKIGFCSILLSIVAIIAMIYGLMYCFIPKPMHYHLNFMGIDFGEFRNSNPGVARMLLINLRVIGVSFLGMGILALGIAMVPFKRTERWVWFTTFPALLVVLIPILVITIEVGGLVPMAITVLILALSLISFLVSAGDFLGKGR
jgi:hypothetical protein